MCRRANDASGARVQLSSNQTRTRLELELNMEDLNLICRDLFSRVPWVCSPMVTDSSPFKTIEGLFGH